jgi:hypothetical protein
LRDAAGKEVVYLVRQPTDSAAVANRDRLWESAIGNAPIDRGS